MRSGLLVFSTIVGLCVALPAFAQDINVRIGHRDHDRGFGRVHGESRTSRARSRMAPWLGS